VRGAQTAERFASNITGEPNTGCWLWTGKTSDKGYGLLRVGPKWARSHRLSWEINYGPVPEAMHVLHRCDVRSCVNPEHLFLGTHADNMADMARKGRVRNGDRAGSASAMAKLSDADVLRIRASVGHVKSLAASLNVSVSAVYKIRAGTRWQSCGK
jgi:hypothetical protein